MVVPRNHLAWTLMLLPFALWLVVFAYAPLFGLVAAFEDFSWGRPFVGAWVGLRNFAFLFADPFFRVAAVNTMFFALVKSVLIVSMPLFLAYAFRRASRNASFAYSGTVMVTHFSSWVVIGVAVRILASPQTWDIALRAGSLLNSPVDARWLFVLSDFLKGYGWVFFVYLVALRSFDPEYWEVAETEGASTLQTFVHVAVPLLAPVAAVVAVLTVTNVVDSTTDQALNLSHPGIYSATDVIGSYAYRTAIRSGHIARAVAASLVETGIRGAVVVATLLAGMKFLRRVR